MSFGPADRAFRDEVRHFLATELPEDIRERWKNSANALYPEKDDAVRWQKIVWRKGWAAPLWPVEWGGPGWTATQKYIWDLESSAAGAPPFIANGIRLVAPVIIAFGTEEQKRRFLPPILSSDEYWCQGYSEPGSGSDLASLRTRAVADGDDYIVTGSKIWTTHAHYSDWMFALVRTADTPKKQQGISFLLIDMKSPGITVRPIVMLGGHHEVNEVFLDGVRVPKANRIGEENQGWTCAKYLLEFERGSGSYVGRININRERLLRVARRQTKNGRPLLEDQGFRRKLAEADMALEAMALTELRVLSRMSLDKNPGPESSLIKVRGSEVVQQFTELTMDALGFLACPFDQLTVAMQNAPGDGWRANDSGFMAPEEAGATPRYFNLRANTIFGGTSEVQRGIIAKAVLGL